MKDSMFKLYTPDYYKEFRCKAGDCNDTCCTAWEIDIDEDTYNLYRNKAEELEINGEDPDFCEKLKKYIVKDEAIHFDLSGRTYCPFFTEEGLCEIQLKMGEKALCQICSDHPRYYEYFPDRKEAGIGICCEKACELVMFHDEPVCFEEKYLPASELLNDNFEISDEDNHESSDEYSEKEESFNALNNFLFDVRSAVIEVIQNRKLSFAYRIEFVIKIAEYIQDMMEDALLFGDELRDPYEVINDIEQESIDISETDEHALLSENIYNLNELKSLLEEHLQAVPLKNEWHELISDLYNNLELLLNIEKDFYDTHKDAAVRYEQLITYFVFRYACKALYDGDFLTKIKFAADSVCIIHLIEMYAYSKGIDLNHENMIRIASAYSKEIEYSEENMNMFMY